MKGIGECHWEFMKVEWWVRKLEWKIKVRVRRENKWVEGIDSLKRWGDIKVENREGGCESFKLIWDS